MSKKNNKKQEAGSYSQEAEPICAAPRDADARGADARDATSQIADAHAADAPDAPYSTELRFAASPSVTEAGPREPEQSAFVPLSGASSEKAAPEASAPASKGRRIAAAVLVLVLAAALIAAAVLFFNRPDTSGLQADPNVRVGTLTGSTADLDKIVDEGMLTFSINSTPTFQNGTAPGNLMIENADINNNRFTVAITRDDTGETIYESGALDPGQYLTDVPLNVALPAGEYVCTATFSTYSLTDNKPIGQAAAGLTIHVVE